MTQTPTPTQPAPDAPETPRLIGVDMAAGPDATAYWTVNAAPTDAAGIAATVCRQVAELPDRNSPEDWPEAMLVTHEELAAIVRNALSAAAPAATQAEQPGAAVPDEPTAEMYLAAQSVSLPTGDDDGSSITLNSSQVRAIWKAMRAAAPMSAQPSDADIDRLLAEMIGFDGETDLQTVNRTDLRRIVNAALFRWAAAPAPAAAPDALELRSLLCDLYCGSLAYRDDGEMSDARAWPPIDFKRDSAATIRESMRKRKERAAMAAKGRTDGGAA